MDVRTLRRGVDIQMYIACRWFRYSLLYLDQVGTRICYHNPTRTLLGVKKPYSLGPGANSPMSPLVMTLYWLIYMHGKKFANKMQSR